MKKVSDERIKDMRRIMLIAENREPLASRIARRYVTVSDNAKEHGRLMFVVLGMLHGAMRR